MEDEIETLRQELRRIREERRCIREETQLLREERRRIREEIQLLREEAQRTREERRRIREEIQLLREETRRKKQKRTLEEYLYNCHFYLYKELKVANEFRLTTEFMEVDGKYYPKWLRPWTSFTNTQQQHHFEAIRTVCGERRLFSHEGMTRALASVLHTHRAGSDNTFDYSQAVENPVRDILSTVWDEGELRKEYRCMALQFSNDIWGFMQPSYDSLVEEEDPSDEWQASEQRFGPPLTNPDGAGVHTHLGGEKSLTFVYDYREAHTVALEYLKPAVAKETLFMEVMEQINRNKSWSDAEPQDEAEALIAMALTQVFDHMVRYQVAYGYTAVGKSLLFLHIDRADPQTLYCHPCVPDEDVGETSDVDWDNDNSRDWADDSNVPYTAVAQLASFCLLSFRFEAFTGASLDTALQKADTTLRKWMEPYDDAAHLLGAEDTDSLSASLSQSTEGPGLMPNAVPTSREVTLRSRSSCRATAMLGRDEEDEDGEPDVSERKEGPSSGSSKGEGHEEEQEDVEMSESAPAKQYCTQACLLGLKRGYDLDDNCPNVLSHRTTEDNTQHPINADEFARLVGERLRQNPYRDCQALDRWGKMGATSVLFKLELGPYGYTFVGKGALPGHPHLLEHESSVYSRLDTLQGEVVPVHLGLVRLDRGYILPGGARVFHMMLMSWAGETLRDAETAGAGTADLAAEGQRSSRAVRAEGVHHADFYDTYRLWNDERRRVMMINFDQAIFLPNLKHKQLLKITEEEKNKKKRRWREEFRNYKRKRRTPLNLGTRWQQT